MLDRQTIQDLTLIVAVCIVLFFVPGWLTEAVDSKESEYRGCVASAHQATRYGHDLEANLEYCEQYKN